MLFPMPSLYNQGAWKVGVRTRLVVVVHLDAGGQRVHADLLLHLEVHARVHVRQLLIINNGFNSDSPYFNYWINNLLYIP